MIDRSTAQRPHGRAGVEIVPTGLAVQVEDYWRARCHSVGPGTIPRRRDIDPAVLGRLRWRDSLDRWQPLARLMVPLSEDGTAVSTLLGLVDYAPGEIVPLRGAA